MNYSFEFIVDTLVHEGLHIRINETLGVTNYVGSELVDFITLSSDENGGAIHNWIYSQSDLARKHAFSSKVYPTKPDISVNAIKSKFK